MKLKISLLQILKKMKEAGIISMNQILKFIQYQNLKNL